MELSEGEIGVFQAMAVESEELLSVVRAGFGSGAVALEVLEEEDEVVLVFLAVGDRGEEGGEGGQPFLEGVGCFHEDQHVFVGVFGGEPEL
jgi:hypothetical protein